MGTLNSLKILNLQDTMLGNQEGKNLSLGQARYKASAMTKTASIPLLMSQSNADTSDLLGGRQTVWETDVKLRPKKARH